MFIVAMKMSRKNRFAFASIAVFMLMGVLVMTFSNPTTTEQVNTKQKTKAKPTQTVNNTADVANFLKSFGWEIDTEAVEIQQIVIPTEFNEVYQNYNILQQKQGYNLDQQKGRTVQRYTFHVKNYPDRPDNVAGNVLVAGKNIIGGDITCMEKDGFVHGFKPQ